MTPRIEELDQIDRLEARELWEAIADRRPGPLAPAPVSLLRRATIIVVSLMIAAAAIAVPLAAIRDSKSSSTAAAEQSVISSPSDSTPSVNETILLHNGPDHHGGADSGEFAPPPAGAQPAVSAHEALDVFFQDNPGIQFGQSDIRSMSVGSYSAVNADGSYRFQDRLAYGIELHVCVTQEPLSCDLWIFLDADTGHLLESAWGQ